MDPAACSFLLNTYGPPRALCALLHVAPGIFVTDPLPLAQLHRTADGWAVVGRQTHYAGSLDAANQIATET